MSVDNQPAKKTLTRREFLKLTLTGAVVLAAGGLPQELVQAANKLNQSTGGLPPCDGSNPIQPRSCIETPQSFGWGQEKVTIRPGQDVIAAEKPFNDYDFCQELNNAGVPIERRMEGCLENAAGELSKHVGKDNSLVFDTNLNGTVSLLGQDIPIKDFSAAMNLGLQTPEEIAQANKKAYEEQAKKEARDTTYRNLTIGGIGTAVAITAGALIAPLLRDRRIINEAKKAEETFSSQSLRQYRQEQKILAQSQQRDTRTEDEKRIERMNNQQRQAHELYDEMYKGLVGPLNTATNPADMNPINQENYITHLRLLYDELEERSLPTDVVINNYNSLVAGQESRKQMRKYKKWEEAVAKKDDMNRRVDAALEPSQKRLKVVQGRQTFE